MAQKLPLPSGFEFSEQFDETGPPKRVVCEPLVDAGRRKPVPRTLQQAFPQSEGYRLPLENAAGQLVPLEGEEGTHRRRWTGLVTPDSVSWLIILGIVGWIVRWAWLAPKVPT